MGSIELKAQIVECLVKGDKVIDIAVKHGVTVGLVQSIRNKYLKGKLDSAVDSLSKTDADTVKALAATLEEQGLDRAAKVAENVAKGVEALQVLQPKITKALSKIVVKLTERLEAEDFQLKEIPMISRTLIEINTALYNKPNNTTQINVNQQQNVIQQAVSERLDKLTKGIFDEEEAIDV